MKICSLPSLPDILIFEPEVHADQRGIFAETWNARRFAAAGLALEFVQENFSRSVKNSLRGLHYQLQNPQGRLVRVVAGTVFDVAVDLRRSSPTFGHWAGRVLTTEKIELLWIPPGFAHGFLALSDFADLEYKCTDFYNPAAERCIIWNDPDLQIDWPCKDPEQLLLSGKDKAGVRLRDAEVFA